MFFRFRVISNAAYIYCAQMARKRDTSENKPIVLRFGPKVQQKENGIRMHSFSFLQRPVHSTLQCEYTAISSPPLKLSGIDNTRMSYFKQFRDFHPQKYS